MIPMDGGSSCHSAPSTYRGMSFITEFRMFFILLTGGGSYEIFQEKGKLCG